MVSENYAYGYYEVLQVLKFVKDEDLAKIPPQLILEMKVNMKKQPNFKINPSKSIEEQNLSNEAKAIIANLFKRYWATDYQKERIAEKEKYDLELLEEEKREKYNPNDIFKNSSKENVVETNKTEAIEQPTESVGSNEIVEHKEGIFAKIKRFFSGLFKK